MADDATRDLVMQVDGMSCGHCAAAVTKAVRGLDPTAAVDVDLGRGRVSLTTRADSLEIARAIGEAGYEARAMTG